MFKHLISLAAALIMSLPVTFAANFADETLNYKIMYKWGVVNKQAGRARLTLTNDGDQYRLLLTARSEPWADRFFKVRDTLRGVVVKEGFKPVIYDKIAHEGGDHKRDVVRYRTAGARTIGECTRKKWDDKGRIKRNEERTLEAYGTVVDMLSSFYYMRTLPFDKWSQGHVVSLNIYSGKCKELLTIKFLGTEDVETDRGVAPAYHIRFQFSQNGGKKSSDDMDAWLSTGATRVPLKLEGKLKVGTVKCFLM